MRIPLIRATYIALVLLEMPAAQAGTRDLATAPAWTLRNLDGEIVRSTDFRGKVIILNFWASDCAPCRKEIPGLTGLYKKYAPQGLVVVGISLDEESRLVERSIRTLDMTYPVVIADPVVTAAYGNLSILPSTFVINKEGRIVALHEGLTETASIEAEIKPLL